jgi:hypothetical protein
MQTPDMAGAMTRGRAAAQELAAERERDAVLTDVNREVGSAAAELVSSDAQAFAARYFDWLRGGRPLSGQPQKPASMPSDVAAIIKERVTDRALALRCGRAA